MDTTRRGAGDVPHFRDIVGHDPYPWQARTLRGTARGRGPRRGAPADGSRQDGVRPVAAACGRCAQPQPAHAHRLRRRPPRNRGPDRRSGARLERAHRSAARALARAFDACAAFPAERPVGLGVLRGGLADDGAWRADPARPTVVVGTVDMVGSRLLFSGLRRRALEAGDARGAARARLRWWCSTRRTLRRRWRRCSTRWPDSRTRGTFARCSSRRPATPRRATVQGLGAADRRSAAVRCRLYARKSVRIDQAGDANGAHRAALPRGVRPPPGRDCGVRRARGRCEAPRRAARRLRWVPGALRASRC